MTTLGKNKQWASARAVTAVEHGEEERERRSRTKESDFYSRNGELVETFTHDGI